ncbi:MAG TPA: amidase, partial [Methylocella sp.]|nr:amidase [Methylocella sp.]
MTGGTRHEDQALRTAGRAGGRAGGNKSLEAEVLAQDVSRRAILKAVGAGLAALAAPEPLTAAARPQDELCYLSAAGLLALYKARKVSPVEVLKAQIARSQRINPLVNCFTHTYFDTAMAAARESGRRWLKGDARPLEGIPTSVKDEDGMAGWTVTAGSVLFKDSKASRNSPIIDKLLAAGAVLHAQTTVPEFYFVPVTWSKLWGVTRNPWNLQITPGGSSGGGAASLAAGLATLAMGSDMGGSIRIPSSLCGLFGFKPPHGRVPLKPGDEIM